MPVLGCALNSSTLVHSPCMPGVAHALRGSYAPTLSESHDIMLKW